MKKFIYIGLGIIAALIAILYLIPAYYKKKGYKLIHHPEPAHYKDGCLPVPAENDLTEITNKNLYTYAHRFWYIKIKKPNNWTIYDPYMFY